MKFDWPQIFTALGVGGIATAIINKIFSRKKDKVEVSSQMVQNAITSGDWVQGKLKEMIATLEERLEKLEADKREQSAKINTLETKVAELEGIKDHLIEEGKRKERVIHDLNLYMAYLWDLLTNAKIPFKRKDEFLKEQFNQTDE